MRNPRRTPGLLLLVGSGALLLTDYGREWVAVDRCLDAGHVYDYRARRCQDEVVQLPYEPYVVRRLALLAVASSLALCGVALIALGRRTK